MASNEAGDSGRGISRRQFAPSDETIARLFSADTRITSDKFTKSDQGDLAVVFALPEQAGRNDDRVEAKQTSDLIRVLSSKEMAIALSPMSERFSSPATRGMVSEHENANQEVIRLGRAFHRGFEKVYGREIKREEHSDRERLAKLLQGHPELEASWNNFEKYFKDAAPKRVAHGAALQSLREEAQRTLDDICFRSNLPPIKFAFTRENMTYDRQATLSGGYRSGSATIILPEQRLNEEPMTRSSVVEIFAHETKHHEQLCLMMAKSIEDTSPDKPLDDNQIKAIQSGYKTEFNIEVTERFILDVQKWKSGHKLTKEERSRAETYVRSHKEDKVADDKEDDILLLKAIDKTAKDKSAWEAFKIIDEFEKKLESTPKPSIESLLKQYRNIQAGTVARDTWNEDDAKQTLDFWAGIWLPTLQLEVRRQYRRSLIENEAQKAGLDAAEAAK